MRFDIRDSAIILGIIGSACIGTLATPAIIAVLGSATTSTLMSGLNTKKIEKWFIQNHPDNLNHSIKKLFMESVDQALGNILIKFEDTNPKRLEYRKAKKLIKLLKKDIPSKLAASVDHYLGEENIRDYFSENSSNSVISREINDLRCQIAI